MNCFLKFSLVFKVKHQNLQGTTISKTHKNTILRWNIFDFTLQNLDASFQTGNLAVNLLGEQANLLYMYVIAIQ